MKLSRIISTRMTTVKCLYPEISHRCLHAAKFVILFPTGIDFMFWTHLGLQSNFIWHVRGVGQSSIALKPLGIGPECRDTRQCFWIVITLTTSCCSALSFCHSWALGPLSASFNPPCRPVIVALRAHWQNIIKWNVKSKRGQRTGFTSSLRVWLKCKSGFNVATLHWVYKPQMQSIACGMS